MRLELEFCVKIAAGYTFLYTAWGEFPAWNLTIHPPPDGAAFHSLKQVANNYFFKQSLEQAARERDEQNERGDDGRGRSTH